MSADRLCSRTDSPEQNEVLVCSERMRSLRSQQGSCMTDFGADQPVGHGGYAARQHIAPQNLRPGSGSVQHRPAVLDRTWGPLHQQEGGGWCQVLVSSLQAMHAELF